MLTALQRRWALAFGVLDLGRRDDLLDEPGARRLLDVAFGVRDASAVQAYLVAPRAGDAFEISRLVTLAASAASAGLLEPTMAWHVIWAAASLAVRSFGSWREFGASYVAAVHAISDGRASADEAIARELADPTSPWCTLPWDLLGGALQPRVLRVACDRCGAPRQRPSRFGYIYCDHCGALVDYDPFAAEPGSPRSHDPAYAARAAAYTMRREAVVAADPEARTLRAEMERCTAQLAFAHHGGVTRVAPDAFAPFVDAAFAYLARHQAVCAAHGVDALHPDEASRNLQERLDRAVFVRGWLPYLGEPEAEALLARTGLAREYTIVPPAATRAMPCGRCGGLLAIVEGARRVVCEHCGGLVDVVGPAEAR